jgi:hypothetical protein
MEVWRGSSREVQSVCSSLKALCDDFCQPDIFRSIKCIKKRGGHKFTSAPHLLRSRKFTNWKEFLNYVIV